ncbi:hypothetical protein D039_3262B, partial [Vibrio parahaemolyticus EKP-028]
VIRSFPSPLILVGLFALHSKPNVTVDV